jgi:ABC transporter substrate binding protein
LVSQPAIARELAALKVRMIVVQGGGIASSSHGVIDSTPGKQQPLVLQVARPDDLVPAFARLVEQRADGLLIISDTMFGTYRNQITALAARHTVPAIYPSIIFVTAGGLISYGASSNEAWRKAGNYVGQILKGAKPADLPVLQPTRFELVIKWAPPRRSGSPSRRRCRSPPTR